MTDSEVTKAAPAGESAVSETAEPETVEANVVKSAKAETVDAKVAEPETVEANLVKSAAPETVEAKAEESAEAVTLTKVAETEESDAAADSDADEAADSDEPDEESVETDKKAARHSMPRPKRIIDWPKVVAYGLLPALLLLLGLTAGGLKYLDNSVRDADWAGMEAKQVATDTTIAILSYAPETVEKQLTDARSLLTGEFKGSYTDLTNNVVIPGAKQQQISASARVPAAAVVSAKPDHAVVLLAVNQTVIIGGGIPSETASTVRVTLDRVDGKWLVSEFDPV